MKEEPTERKEIIMERCDKCGKEMTDERGASLIGMVLEVVRYPEGSMSEEFVEKQLGKYEMNRRYKFCFECCLDSLFGLSCSSSEANMFEDIKEG